MEEKAKVYWCDFRAVPGTNLLEKLKRLMRHAGIETIDFDKKMAAIKIHFGEPGNLSYLRPNYAKAVADVVKELGGMPFLNGLNNRFKEYCKNNKDAGGIDLLEEVIEYGIREHGFEPDAWVFQLVDAIIGDN